MLDLFKKIWPWAVSHVVVGALCAFLGLSHHPAQPPPPATTKAEDKATVSATKVTKDEAPVETKTRTVYFQTDKNCTITYPDRVVERDVIRGAVQTTTEKGSAVVQEERDTSTPIHVADRPRLSLALFPVALALTRKPYLVLPPAEVGVRVVGNWWVEALYAPGDRAYVGLRHDF